MNKTSQGLCADKFSIIIPVFNEELTIGPLIKDLRERYWGADIIVVDDGSNDNTFACLKNLNVKIFRHSRNRGYGAALKTGIKNASRNDIIIMDGDGAFSIDDIEAMAAMNEGMIDLIIGVRQYDFPFYKKIARGFVLNLLSRISKQKVFDFNSGLRLFKKNRIIKYFHILPDGFSFTSSMTLIYILEGHVIKYAPICFSKRQDTLSKVKTCPYIFNFIKSYARIIYRMRLSQSRITI